MFSEFTINLSRGALVKRTLLKQNLLQYLVSATFAGAFIGIGILLTFTVGGSLKQANSPFLGVVNGMSFAVALSMVVFTATELFTGNNLVMTSGFFNKTVSFSDMLAVWSVSYIGNLMGALFISLLFICSGLCVDSTAAFFEGAAHSKAVAGFIPLLCRGILCNILVCLAILICSRVKSESGKILIILMCIYPFVTCGFEHCVANMTVYAVAYISGAVEGITLYDISSNLIPVTIGNIIGGSLVIGGGFYFLGKK